MAATVSESAAAPAETSLPSTSNSSNAPADNPSPLKKPQGRTTAVSKVYELLTRPPPSSSVSVLSSTMTASLKSADANSLPINANNSNKVNNGPTATVTSTSSTITAVKTFPTNRSTSPSANGYDCDTLLSYRQQRQMLTIQNGHHYIHNFKSRPGKPSNATGSTSSNSYSPSSSSSSSSSQHSPPEPAQDMSHPVPKRFLSLPYTKPAAVDDDDDDGPPRITAGPMSSLLVIRDGDRPFDFYRSKFGPRPQPRPTAVPAKVETDEDYPPDFVMCSGRASASWANNFATPTVTATSALHISEMAEVSSGYSSNGHSPVPIRRRSTCLCSSLGLGCCNSTRSVGSSPMRRPGTGPGATAGQAQRSASSIKDALLKWCQQVTADYESVNVTNFSSSWSDGIAFCAIVHHYFPNAFDFRKLDPKRRKANFKLAFDLAEKFGDVPQLLEVEDMVRMKQPDWKCVFTYVQTMYRKLHDRQPTLLPPRKASGDGNNGSTTTTTTTTSGVESASSGSPSKVPPPPVPAGRNDDDAPSNPFKAEFENMSLNY